MNIFLNAVSEKGMFLLFDNNRQIIDTCKIAIGGQESMKFIELLDSFVKDNKLGYTDIENIILVNGPGSFTGIRTICLAVNTLNFIIKKNLTDIGFFELYNNYPIVKPSSKRDLFVKKTKTSKIELINNDDFINYIEENKIQKIYGNFPKYIASENLNLEDEIDYAGIIKNTKFKDKKIIEPLYIKKPNIC